MTVGERLDSVEQFDIDTPKGTVHVTVYRKGDLTFQATFARGSIVERHDLDHRINDITTAREHAVALLGVSLAD